MATYAITCCSTADLTEEHFRHIGVSYVPFHFAINEVEYTDDMGKSLPYPQFYQILASGAKTRTSQVNTQEFTDFWRPILAQGLDILHVSLSSGLSGVINSAESAAALLREEFPERQIFVVDSLGASSGYGMLVDALAGLRDGGATIAEAFQWALDNRLHLHHWFFSGDLSFYVAGGRISKASGFIGNALKICPLLNMDAEGHLNPVEKIRTKKKTIKAMVDRMVEHANGGLAYNGKCYISQSNCYEDARAVADLVEETFPNLAEPVTINFVGTTIGSHTGPGTVAMYFWGSERK